MPYINTLVSARVARMAMIALILAVLALWGAATAMASGDVNPRASQPMVLAQEEDPDPDADAGTSTTDVLAQEGDSDPEANLPFLFAVYIITWGGFFAYVFAMSRRQREMQRELDALKAAITEKESQSGAGQAE